MRVSPMGALSDDPVPEVFFFFSTCSGKIATGRALTLVGRAPGAVPSPLPQRSTWTGSTI